MTTRGGRRAGSVPTKIDRYLARHPNEYFRALDIAPQVGAPTHLTAVMLGRAYRDGRVTRNQIQVRGWKRPMTVYGMTSDQAAESDALWADTEE